ncbi:hypothetical protein RRG08_012145 [Elysia crispata]|uniref:G-protein coupled receptors family 1 profile domain-containing protein n=2 Tax=Elysia crispata TaxID=231223 RepID=A0AAE1DH57_9GAST|nr:hypothetical protein RRG08_012145 [Elysia crispata]
MEGNLIVYNISVAARGLNGSLLSTIVSSSTADKLNGSSTVVSEEKEDLSFIASATSSSNFTTPGPANYPYRLFKREASSLQKFAMPVVLSVGILGGMALVLVFMRTPLRRSALANYLTAAGVTNTVYLLCSGVLWLTLHQGIPVQNVTGVCQLTMFALHLSKFLATWYLILAHLERFIYQFSSRTASPSGSRPCQVRGPRAWQDNTEGAGTLVSPRMRKWCGIFRAKCIIIVVFIFSMVGFLHYIWTYMVIEGRCMIMRESLKHILRLHKVENFASIFLPVFLIIIIDVALLIQMIHRLSIRLITRTSTPSRSPTSQRSRMGLTSDAECRGEYTLASTGRNGVSAGAGPHGGRGNGRTSPHSSNSRSPSICKSGEKKLLPPELDLSCEQGRATGVVVIEGFLFAAVLLPFSVMAIKSQFGQMTKNDIEIQTLIEELVKVNAAIKFFLYFVMLSTFRKGFLYLICCCCRRRVKAQGDSLQETSV